MNDTQNPATDAQNTGATHFNAADFQTQLEAAGEKPVFVDFYADWCGPCKIAEPVVNRLAGEYKDAVLAKLDVDENPEVAQKYGVMSIPTVLIFKKGQEIDRKVGFPGEPVYRQMLEKAGATAAPKAA